jgi:hypothetical protein
VKPTFEISNPIAIGHRFVFFFLRAGERQPAARGSGE